MSLFIIVIIYLFQATFSSRPLSLMLVRTLFVVVGDISSLLSSRLCHFFFFFFLSSRTSSSCYKILSPSLHFPEICWKILNLFIESLVES